MKLNATSFINAVAQLLGKPIPSAANEEYDFDTMANELTSWKSKMDGHGQCNERAKGILTAAKIAIPGGDAFSVETFANEIVRVAGELTTVTGKVATLTTDVGAATTRATTAEGKLATAEQNFANETAKVTDLTGKLTAATGKETTMVNERQTRRTNRSKRLLDHAITVGTITQAERAGYEAQFANEATHDTAEAALLALKPKFRTGSQFGPLGGRASEAHAHDSNNKQDKFLQMVNERMTANKTAGKQSDYDFCFSQVNAENPTFWTT